MDFYSVTSAKIAQLLTRRYSSSFSSASRLFAPEIRLHIYNIYGLVRIADEIVDTYKGSDRSKLLIDLEEDTYCSITRKFSPNPLVQAFADTANKFGIDSAFLHPFFESMRLDLVSRNYNQLLYEQYIFGSAEVVGLMCLCVFVEKNSRQYKHLEFGARKLGSAYQKVNFLRDMADDYHKLGRFYFPNATYDSFDETDKHRVTTDIRQDFEAAQPYVTALPTSAKYAVDTSFRYYLGLLARLERASVAQLKSRRLQLPAHQKAWLLAPQLIKGRRH